MVKFTILLFSSLMLFAISAIAQPKLEVKEGAKIEFGDVYSGQKATKEITVSNTGSDTLHIRDVRAQCGCTATLIKQKSLAPGESSPVSITFNSNGYHAGKYQKHVYIDSDDPASPTFTVEFEPNVIQLLELLPGMFSFNNAKVDSEYTKTITIKNPSKDTITILSVENKFDPIKIVLSKMKITPGDSSIITATLHPTTSGSFQSTVELLTDHPMQSKLDVKIFAWVNRK